MRDRDIRTALRESLKENNLNDQSSLIIDEVGLCNGEVRVDMAVVNGSFNGYEIKSEKDTLERLPVQQGVYSRIFDTVTVVTGDRHVPEVMRQVPSWWGITKVKKEGKKIRLYTIREPEQNENVDPLSLAKLLWRDEVLKILEERGLASGMLSKPRRILWQKLVENLTLAEIRHQVRECLKVRANWRVARKQKLNGDLFLLSSK